MCKAVTDIPNKLNTYTIGEDTLVPVFTVFGMTQTVNKLPTFGLTLKLQGH